MEYASELYHYGVKGMKWGVRRNRKQTGGTVRAKSGDDNRERRKKIAKRVAAGTAAVVTVAAAATVYAKNKNAIDSVVKKYASKAVKGLDLVKNEAEYRKTMGDVTQLRKKEKYARTHKSKILKSPAKLKKYRDFYDEDTVKKAISKIQQEQTLNELNRKQVRNGADYVQSILAYGTVATTAYALANSQPIKDAKKKRKKN